MLFRLIVALVCVSVALAGAKTTAAVPVKETSFLTSFKDTITDLTKDNTLSASVDGIESSGLEGLNLKFTAPYEFMDYVVGFKTKITDLKSLAPDSLFVRKSFDDVDVAVDYDVASKKFSANTRWSNDKVAIQVDADSEDMVTQVAASVKQTFSNEDSSRSVNTKLRAVYDTLTKKVTSTLGLATGDAAAQLDFDVDAREAILGVSYKLNEFTANPVINLNSGAVKYGLSRTVGGGDIGAVLTPYDNVEVEWSDKASSGTWKTKVNYPLDGGQTKVSFARDFEY